MIKRISRCFEVVSDLTINLAESTMVSVGCSEDCICFLARRVKCGVGKLPFLFVTLVYHQDLI